ncbi:MAG TPA: alkaline phosphatase family protein [Clostridia bacterium]|nr:alkaline phosphatase family protein [Clostridia bacterium]
MKDGRQIQVFVLIDALGWTYLKDRDFLQDVLPYRTPLRTVLGFSSGAIPTILTGVPPAENGHWNLFYYDPNGSPFWWLKYFSFLPDAILDHRVPRKILKELGRRVLGLGKSFEVCVNPHLLRWFNWVEKKNIYAQGGITGAPSIFDQLAAKDIPHRIYSYHDLRDEQIFQTAKRDLVTGAADFYFVYLCEMDEFLHHHCEHPDQLEERLAWYDAQLRELFAVARSLDPDATLAVFSDHGMTPVREHYDLIRDINALGLQMPKDYLAVYDSTMARFWFFNDRAREAVTGLLDKTACGRIVSDREQQQLGIFFPDRRFGESIFLMNPGMMLAHSDFNGPRWMPTGMHGYHPDDAYSDASFLSNRQPSFPMSTIADIYPLMRTALEE